NIPEPLLTSMELISIAGYTEVEKVHIAKEHVIPKQSKENGWNKGNSQIRDGAPLKANREYTREAAARGIERRVATLCKKPATLTVCGEQTRVIVTEKRIEELLGKPIYRYGRMEQEDEVGTATGPAYTAVGSDTLSIEVSHYPGKGEFILTGKLGEVM